MLVVVAVVLRLCCRCAAVCVSYTAVLAVAVVLLPCWCCVDALVILRCCLVDVVLVLLCAVLTVLSWLWRWCAAVVLLSFCTDAHITVS